MTDPPPSDIANPSKERRKSPLDSSSHHERSGGGGGGGGGFSFRKWVELSFMIVVGLMLGYAILSTRHVLHVIDGNEVDHELLNSAGPSPRAKSKARERLLRKESTQAPTEALLPPRAEIHPDEKHKLIKPMFETMELHAKMVQAAAEDVAETKKIELLKEFVTDDGAGIGDGGDDDDDDGDDDDDDDDD
eukprot:CAMPEP_0197186278 /NCGR_PEP_ID=MMETSP1423-20130617/13604_1 /TAXON_ID=476441 /ORGANISM="Pseudo-nitzschia heimii, Strain UNC1101" /LENGTH=189 /DNA_ID=CAMNT_0042637549 /DNA_START=60 /DNA_END=626 /DNA_ORIENTATION=+